MCYEMTLYCFYDAGMQKELLAESGVDYLVKYLRLRGSWPGSAVDI